MSMFHSLHSSASALTAQRLRMDVISSNIANAQSTRATVNQNGEVEPYRRKMVALQPEGASFQSFLHKAANAPASSGVRVRSIEEDETPFKQVYNPSHPDANGDGYVQLPNVDPLKEMVDLMSATRSYEANITSVNATKSMLMKALEIGK
ncbi:MULTISPECIES: flagellar basal body rod protein FlgC [Virgibacillus]|uniref:Flagellar basal-body rod protein FlgC n=1 Tax=Virgibacillus dokdonensis TaxID=302167 RepID=A0A2K9J421_9BACI|nr:MULTISPECIES: flagellar basal body rod protein FlgC [Virgibacillus]AUJ26687.1 Flagellar basal-body rod protein FlgC [Virgibacillus dokdonensis]NWO12965.1 flagellar basal body rod protein FlgC [Virgibacillus sp.]